MNKTLLLLLLTLTSCGVIPEMPGQKYVDSSIKTILKDADMEKKDDKVSYGDRFYINKGNDKIVPVPFHFSASTQRYESVSIDAINEMIATANTRAMNYDGAMKSYVPKDILFFYVDDAANNNYVWLVIIIYATKNEFGDIEGHKAFITFDDAGVFKRILTQKEKLKRRSFNLYKRDNYWNN